MLPGKELDSRHYGADAEKTAALAGLAFFVVARAGMTMARAVLVGVTRADAVVVVGQAMCGRRAEREYGGRRHQT